MANKAVLAAAAAAIPIPGANVVAAAFASGGVQSIITALDPGKARDAARIQRRDFFLNAAKAGSVTAARYLISGANMVYTVKEKSEYDDGVKELQAGSPAYQQTLAMARNLGPLWDDQVGAGELLTVGSVIAAELGKSLDVPNGALGVGTRGAIEDWARRFGYTIRQDTSQAIAQAAAGIGSAVTSAAAPEGSANKNALLLPTNATTLAIAAVGIAALLYFAMRKR